MHNAGFHRMHGLPAVVLVHDEKTAIGHGAGAWGKVTAPYRRPSETVQFHVDALSPRSPQVKKKVERQIRTQRGSADPTRHHWDSVTQLRVCTDPQDTALARLGVCPATGISVWKPWDSRRSCVSNLCTMPYE